MLSGLRGAGGAKPGACGGACHRSQRRERCSPIVPNGAKLIMRQLALLADV